MMTMWMSLLMLFGASASIAKLIYRSEVDPLIQLDMAQNSVDDMYEGCEDKMATKVKTEFLVNEKKTNKHFALVWNAAEEYYKKKWKPKPGKKRPKTLEKEQNMAIYAFTLDKPEIYAEFNNAVRTQRDQYQGTFQYHSLHFFLTGALKVLNSCKPKSERCLTVYRRANKKFNLGIVRKNIRFGAFTSSSMGDYPNEIFGNETCFKIYTCLGADVSLYSKFGESEREFLIPPYEIFKVIEVKKRSDDKNLPCEVVMRLKSTEKSLSNLNCAYFPDSWSNNTYISEMLVKYAQKTSITITD
ncbi:NAD(P)(+)--arginine ADP-ribosyltransferase 1 [Fundulus heteroclitus]|uniref:NAD(P)(+)--arginine ADP-ribosyltransferase 1 n=1 Tax=Fundulus heteroclitus TaxID=8078 RepID=UPI00165C7B73|nr:NAD(P)(+)--arginine ADP-ribosyltransferase 1 [Fundulus heteroclitus]